MIWLRRHWLRLLSCAALLAAIPACTGQQSNATGPQWSAGDGTPDLQITPAGSQTLTFNWTPAIEVNGGTITYQVLGTVGAPPTDSGKEVPLSGGSTTTPPITIGTLTTGPWIFQLTATDGFGNTIVSQEYTANAP